GTAVSAVEAPRSVNIVRSPTGATSTTMVPVRPTRCTLASTPAATSPFTRRSPAAAAPPRPVNRALEPSMPAAKAATLAALPPRRWNTRTGVSVAPRGGSDSQTTTSSTRSPTAQSIRHPPIPVGTDGKRQQDSRAMSASVSDEELALAGAEEEGQPSPLAPLREPTYRRYFIGNVVSNLGSFCQAIAQSLLVYDLTGSSFLVGVVNFAQFIGVLVLAPWTGVAADRFDRRNLIITTQFAAGVVTGVLTILSALGY